VKILIIADPGIVVPPKGYGGIERVVAMLAREYYINGHCVEILANKGSHIEGVKAHFNGNSGFPQTKINRYLSLIRTWFFLVRNYHKYDVIQNFGRLLFLVPILKSDIKKIMCYQRHISTRNISILELLSPRKLYLFGCSKNLVEKRMLFGSWNVIYNPINSLNYSYNSVFCEDLPLIFLSRIVFEKGCHIAIEIAKMTNNKLIIAGNKSNLPEDIGYFEKFVLPFIDGKQIVYVGEVDDIQKSNYLRNAKAMLFPILWDEPFGIVMIESMICGTPVIAFNRGSVNEVIDEGVTGFKVNDKNEMANAIFKLSSIDRNICHHHTKSRFDISVIASQYLSVV
jgi:glycosyltransferase involved in cell wall biosynthesis